MTHATVKSENGSRILRPAPVPGLRTFDRCSDRALLSADDNARRRSSNDSLITGLGGAAPGVG